MPLGPEIIADHVVSQQDMDNVLEWIDSIPLSRPKKSLARDFSDGVLVAELLQASIPKLVELHNYIPTHSVQQKKVNWEVLNRRALARLNLKVGERAVQEIVMATPGAVEPVLWAIRKRILQLGNEKLRPRTSSLSFNASRAKPSLPPRNRPVSVHRPIADIQPALGGLAQASAPAAPSPVLNMIIDPSPLLEPARKTSSRAARKTYLGMAPAIGNTPPAAEENNNSILDEIPKILYRGHEMVDYKLAVGLIKKNSDLLMAQRELERKVALTEKLIGIKEKRIEALSQKVQQEKRRTSPIYDRIEADDDDEEDEPEHFHSALPSSCAISIPPTASTPSGNGTSGSGSASAAQFLEVQQQPAAPAPARPAAPAPTTKIQGPPRRVYVDI